MRAIGMHIPDKALAICARYASEAQGRLDALAASGAPFEPRYRKPTECATCGDSGWLRVDVSVGHRDFGTMVKCTDCGVIDKMLAVKRRRNAAIPYEMQSLSFSTFRAYTPLLADVLALMHAFVADPTGFIYLYGAPGNGKTHLAGAAAMRLVDTGHTTRFYRMVDLARVLRDASVSDPGMLTSLMRQIENVEILILDDFPPEHITPFLYEQIYAMLDYRYITGAATIITSNLPIESLDMPRLVSRLSDNRLSTVIGIDAGDYRQIEDRAALPFANARGGV